MIEHASSSPAMYVEVNSERYPLKLGQIYMFGRQTSTNEVSPEHIINLDDEDVDEKHCCVLDSVDEGVFVFDLLSKHSTFLNGERLKPLKKTLIRHGDVMRLGSTGNVKFYEQTETSHNSSGYAETNKNTSDVISFSPESTSHKESRVKLFNTHNYESQDDTNKFLVPAAPNRLVRTAAVDLLEVSGTENMSNSRVSLGLNSSNNQTSFRSDSFTIPETQPFKPRTSIASNLSIAESDAGEVQSKSSFNLDSFGVNNGEDEDDFCIPETQDIPTISQMPRSLRDAKVVSSLKTLEEKSVDLKDSDDEGILDGSQFRICTQDYNEGFGEEDNESMLHSQVIPLIKHTTVLLNGSNEKRTPNKTSENIIVNEDHAAQEAEKELANINWASSSTKDAEENKNITSNCSTPDLFEFAAFDSSKAAENDGNGNKVNLFDDNCPDALQDEEDYLATQVFPARNSNSRDKALKEKDILCGKEDEQYLTLSDKENLHPDRRLEPVTDLPPNQLFATRDVPSTSLRPSSLHQTEPQLIPQQVEEIAIPKPLIVIESNITLQAAGDEEDDILTQAYPQALRPAPITADVALSKNNCLNSTLLDDKAANKTPATFFAEMEKTPQKRKTTTTSSDVFKMPELGFSNLKKTSSAASTASNVTMCSESDMDLLMCTPQLIKDHLQFSKSDDLSKNIMAARNNNLFGSDTDDGEDTEDDRNSKDKCLVQIINVPKDSKDFDKLLPHLKNEDNRLKRKKSILTNEQIAAKEAYKEYKFNLSFGKEPENPQTSSKSSTRSRDERHAVRDKEKEIEQKRKPKTASTSNVKKQENNVKRSSSNRSKQNEATTSGAESTDAQKTKDKGTKEEQLPINKQNTKSGTVNNEEKQQEKEATTALKKKEAAALKKKEKSSSKRKEEKDAKKKTEKDNEDNKNVKNKVDATTENESKSATNKTADVKNEEQDEKKLRRGRKRVISTDTVQEPSNSKQQKTVEIKNEVPNRRITRLNSATITEVKEIPKKEKKATRSSLAMSVAASDELDAIATQPLRRTTRTVSRSISKDPNVSLSSAASTSSRASSANRSLNQSNSRSNVSNNALAIESAAIAVPASKPSTSKPVAERKRKADIPVPAAPQAQIEGKRLRRTISQDLKCLISMTMVDVVLFKELATEADGLWAVAKDPADSTILVMDKAFRTFKFLLAMARGIPIVTSKWLQRVNETKSLKKAPINEYLFYDPQFERKFKFSLEKSLEMAKVNHRIFNGYTFCITSKIQPQPVEIKAIIEFGGGTVLTTPPPVADNQKIYLVSSVDDRKEWHKFRRENKNIIIVSTEAIMSSVMRQNCTYLSNYVLS